MGTVSSWKWWVVVVGQRDYYIMFDTVLAVKARTSGEAEKKALDKHIKQRGHSWFEICATIGPLDTEPQIDQS